MPVRKNCLLVGAVLFLSVSPVIGATNVRNDLPTDETPDISKQSETNAPPSFNSFMASCCKNPGDANDDAVVDYYDFITVIGVVFAGWQFPPVECYDQGDANGDGSYNIADATGLLQKWLFNDADANSDSTKPVCP